MDGVKSEPIKTWTDSRNFECIGGIAIYGLRQWKKEPSMMVSGRIAWK